jgi:hypothetical protein
VTEDECDKEAADAAVAIEEWMDGLELDVCYRGPSDGGKPVVVSMKEALEVGHRLRNVSVGRRHEHRVPGPAPSDPVLRASKLSRLLLAAATA